MLFDSFADCGVISQTVATQAGRDFFIVLGSASYQNCGNP